VGVVDVAPFIGRSCCRRPFAHTALVPGVTEMGHGPFRFLLERWGDGLARQRRAARRRGARSRSHLRRRSWTGSCPWRNSRVRGV